MTDGRLVEQESAWVVVPVESITQGRREGPGIVGKHGDGRLAVSRSPAFPGGAGGLRKTRDGTAFVCVCVQWCTSTLTCTSADEPAPAVNQRSSARCQRKCEGEAGQIIPPSEFRVSPLGQEGRTTRHGRLYPCTSPLHSTVHGHRNCKTAKLQKRTKRQRAIVMACQRGCAPSIPADKASSCLVFRGEGGRRGPEGACCGVLYGRCVYM